ncbi:DUF433 domain-containing protein [Aeoliella sp. ICT_H6.2]|uniref:DUF433 domain-containing protein n=1 Tax=Aeoliella straminimaris TaxID=2954799 RepID=A0A9X2FB30_9BACT|nr:DUF433 domain-containing protein [Aeoliella straminimaris]MCO6045692.1 DUF433 domain-containing protein [Aeoliella straminimaris]
MTRRIVNTKDTCAGEPRIEGTRLTCSDVVLTLTVGQMPLEEYLEVYDYLSRDDIETSVSYCATKMCMLENVIAFCHGCSLNTSSDYVAVEFESLEDEGKLDVWRHANDLLRKL